MSDANRFLSDLARALDGAIPARVGLAVSGGPDSVAMLALAADALPGRVEAATVDHGLRTESAAEAAMVADLCRAIDVPHATLRPERPVTGGAGVQARAREARYRLLGGWAEARELPAVLTAHHADDQAETFLMRAGRAAGLAGLAGVRPRAVIGGLTVARPLLDWRRAELRAVARRRELPFADDPSNRDDRYERARVRHLLEANEWLAPAGIARAAAHLAEADADLSAAVAWLWDARAALDGAEVRVDAADLPRELRRRLLRRAVAAVREAGGIAEPAFTDASNVEPLLDALEEGRRATQGGVAASVRAGRWRLRPQPARRGG